MAESASSLVELMVAVGRILERLEEYDKKLDRIEAHVVVTNGRTTVLEQHKVLNDMMGKVGLVLIGALAGAVARVAMGS